MLISTAIVLPLSVESDTLHFFTFVNTLTHKSRHVMVEATRGFVRRGGSSDEFFLAK